ncbi:MAG: hypothetical protein RR390_00485 [Hafnia sp.]
MIGSHKREVIDMKISNSKKALAKVIHENGGWVAGKYAVYGKQSGGCLFLACKPTYNVEEHGWFVMSNWISGGFYMNPIANWHQTILSKEEYFHLYPVADDGWIERNGGECPVDGDANVDTKHRDGRTDIRHKASGAWWNHTGSCEDIIAYRLHNPDVNIDLCESVTRSIPEPSAKPTIEQLAADYRNKLDFASRKQQEADDAKAAADAALGELERAGEALGLLISAVKTKPEPEPVTDAAITDWRDLEVGDEIMCDASGNWDPDLIGRVCIVKDVEEREYTGCMPILAECEVATDWGDKFKFVRRP